MNEPTDNPYVRKPDTQFQAVDKLTEAKANEQVTQLRTAIEYHDYRYYVANDPIISDNAYDRLFDRLETLEREFGLVDEHSPTQRVGSEPIDELETHEHVTEMLSLDSSEDEAEVYDFAERVRDEVDNVTYSLEPKFDGFSVELVYTDGMFDRAVTRGDGEEGEDVSANVKTIRTVPLQIPDAPEFLAVRAEVYMPHSGFQALNEQRIQEGEDPFANPRNAAAGTVRQLDSRIVADRPLDIYFYDVMDSSQAIETQEDVFELLADLGFQINEYNQMADDIETFVSYREELLDERDELEYEIDGVVAKINAFEQQAALGETARHPRWAFAYKFPPKTGETSVERITVQVGRTGKLTPVALLDPVDVSGVTISRATLYNEAQAQDLGVVEGATVEIERAGDVIPQVVAVIEAPDGMFEMPEQCPVCGSDITNEGPNHFCTGGMSCDAQLTQSLEHFASREAMNIEGVGEEIAETLVEAEAIGSIAELYQLEKDELTALEPFAEQSAENLLREIEASKNPDLASFLYALGIRHVGTERARLLAEHFSLDELETADAAELKTIGDIGPEVATSIYSFFANDSNRETIHQLRNADVTPERRERGDEFEGVILVFTGSIEDYSRTELIELMENHGASVTSSVSSETNYLVVGDDPGSTKLEHADAFGVETIAAGDFKERFLSEIGALS